MLLTWKTFISFLEGFQIVHRTISLEIHISIYIDVCVYVYISCQCSEVTFHSWDKGHFVMIYFVVAFNLQIFFKALKL